MYRHRHGLTEELPLGRLLLLLAVVSAWRPALLAQAAPRADATPPCVSDPLHRGPVTAEINSNKPFAQARINNSPTLRLLLDTGSAYASIDKKLVNALGFHRRADERYSDSFGKNEVTETTLQPPACEEMAGVKLPNGEITALDLAYLSSAEGFAVDGLLGSDFFNRYIVVIDYPHGTVEVLDSSFEYRGSGIVLPVTIEDGQIFPKAIFRKATGESIEAKLCVDTGARMTLLLTHSFALKNGIMDGRPAVRKATIGVGFGGETQGALFRLPELALGPLKLRGIPSTVSLQENLFASSFPDVVGIIGGGFLRRCKLFLDYPHKRIVLETTSESNKPFTFDETDMFLLAEGMDFKSIKVLRVIPGSPADAAGIIASDFIESINGVSAGSFGLERIRQMFLVDHQTYRLQVKRDGKILSVVLKTSDLLSTPAANRVPVPIHSD